MGTGTGAGTQLACSVPQCGIVCRGIFIGRATALADGAGCAGTAATAAIAASLPPLGADGDIVQAMAAVRKSTAPRAGSHIGVLGSGRGSL